MRMRRMRYDNNPARKRRGGKRRYCGSFTSYARHDWRTCLFPTPAKINRSHAVLRTHCGAKALPVGNDTSLAAGQNFAREIERQIDQSKATLVIWTARSSTSDWVLAEVQRAYTREKLICIKDADLSVDRIPLPYNALHNLTLQNTAEILQRLRTKGIQPSLLQQAWQFYEESPELRRKAMSKLARIAHGYRKSSWQAPDLHEKDPSLDVRIEYHLVYDYDREVELTTQIVRSHPILQFNNFRDYRLTFLEPPDCSETAYDLFDNVIQRISYKKHLRSFGFKVSLIVNLTAVNPFAFLTDVEPPVGYKDIDQKILRPYLKVDRDAEHLSSIEFASSVVTSQNRVDRIRELLTHVSAKETLSPHDNSMSGRERHLGELLSAKYATASERSRVLVNLLRNQGFAARYVSGYVIEPQEYWLKEIQDGDWGVTYHEWVQTYIAGAGWIGLDPQSGLFTEEHFVPMACGPSLSDIFTIEGATEHCQVSLKTSGRAAPISRALCFDQSVAPSQDIAARRWPANTMR
jgi:transglutaminase-like putative cysteine protease